VELEQHAGRHMRRDGDGGRRDTALHPGSGSRVPPAAAPRAGVAECMETMHRSPYVLVVIV